jgi:thymidylate synthase (FAD)
MHVKLIAKTVPVSQEHGGDLTEFVAYCARVSNPANQGNRDTALKLVNYLIRNGHWSPLEMASVTMEINTTRDIARQILRHRSFSFQEFSQRYAEVVDMATARQARAQDIKNRQNSLEWTGPKAVSDHWEWAQNHLSNMASDTYQWAITNGIAKEVARAVLPDGLTMSKIYMAGTLRSWLHYIHTRTAPGTQLEHREVAEAVAAELKKEFRFPSTGNLAS